MSPGSTHGIGSEVERLADRRRSSGRVLQVGAEQSVHRVVLDHRRVDVRRVDELTRIERLAQLDRERAHQADDAVLGRRRSGRRAGTALQAGGRAGEDDRAAAAACDQVRDRRLDGLPHAGQVDVDHVLPDVFVQSCAAGRRRCRCRRWPRRCRAGRAPRPRRRRAAFSAGEVADVDARGDDPPVERLDQRGGLGQILRRGRRARRRRRSGWQRSMAMMSAPSSASRTAWLRPWPRAAPVMKATFARRHVPSSPPPCAPSPNLNTCYNSHTRKLEET